MADVVLIDTAPLLASSINRELATMVDGVVALCVRVGRTTVAQAERCGDLLAQIRAPAIGVVMTGVTAPEGSAYFAYWTLRHDRRPEATTLAPGRHGARAQRHSARPDGRNRSGRVNHGARPHVVDQFHRSGRAESAPSIRPCRPRMVTSTRQRHTTSRSTTGDAGAGADAGGLVMR